MPSERARRAVPQALATTRNANASGCHPITASIPSSAGRRRRIWSRCADDRSEEHTSELQSLMRISYAVFCLKKKTRKEDANAYIQQLREITHAVMYVNNKIPPIRIQS